MSWKTIAVIGGMVAGGVYAIGPSNLLVLVPPFLK
jgi:hypothetical protein